MYAGTCCLSMGARLKNNNSIMTLGACLSAAQGRRSNIVLSAGVGFVAHHQRSESCVGLVMTMKLYLLVLYFPLESLHLVNVLRNRRVMKTLGIFFSAVVLYGSMRNHMPATFEAFIEILYE